MLQTQLHQETQALLGSASVCPVWGAQTAPSTTLPSLCPRDRALTSQLSGVLLTPGHLKHMQLYTGNFSYLVCSYSKQAAKNTAFLSSCYSKRQKLERICIYQQPENKGGGNFSLEKAGKFPASLLSAPALSRHQTEAKKSGSIVELDSSHYIIALLLIKPNGII